MKKIHKVKVLLTVLLTFHISTTVAAEWVFLAEDNDSKFFIDRESISEAHIGLASFTQAWVRKETKLKDDEAIHKFTTMDALHFNDCREKQFSVRYAIYRNNEGVVSHGNFPDQSFHPTPPESIVDMIIKYVCSQTINN